MQSLIDELKLSTPLSTHPYFLDLSSGKITKKQFIDGQLDFYQAVVYFSRPMMQLASRFEAYHQRWSILENVLEEHGRGRSELTHGAQFCLLLNHLGISTQTLELHVHHPAVEIFNLTLSAIASQKDWRFAVAVLGMIEDRFSEISAYIGQAIVDNAWLTKERLCHYTLHAKLDVSHAQEFYQLIDKEWNEPDGRIKISQGLRLGNYLFLDLYRQLWLIYTAT